MWQSREGRTCSCPHGWHCHCQLPGVFPALGAVCRSVHPSLGFLLFPPAWRGHIAPVLCPIPPALQSPVQDRAAGSAAPDRAVLAGVALKSLSRR